MRTTKLKVLTIITASLVGIGLAGCQASESDPGTSAEHFEVIFTEGSALVTDWDVWVADEEGFFEDHNVEVDAVTTETANAATQLLVTGEAHIGRSQAPMIQSMHASDGGVQLVDVGDALVRPPLVFSGGDEVESIEDVPGTNVGTSSPTDNTTIVTVHALETLGFSEGSYELLPSGGTGARFAGLQEGALDVTPLFPPVSITAESEGYTSLGFLPDLLGEDYYYAFSGVIVNPDWAEDNQDALVAYLSARNDALEFMADSANRDRVIEIFADTTESELEEAEAVYDMLGIGTPESVFADEIGIHEEAVQGTIDALQLVGQAPDDAEVSDYTDDSYAETARSE